MGNKEQKVDTISNKEHFLKNRKNNAICCNWFVVFFGLFGVLVTLKEFGHLALQQYTQLTNYLATIVAIIYLIFAHGKKGIPKWVSFLKYTATVCLTITFLIVLLVLFPMCGFNIGIFIFGSNLMYHTICPIANFISFMKYEDHNITGLKNNIRSLYFTIIYAIVIVILNALNIVDGPYDFVRVNYQPIYMSIIWLVVIFSMTLIISKVIMNIKEKENLRLKEKLEMEK